MKKDFKPIKVLVADDHSIVRDGLKALLERHPLTTVVADAKTGLEAIDLAAKYEPDVIIMDINMPDLNGVDATRRILDVQPDVKIIAISMHVAKHYVIDILQAGASGYLLKLTASEELIPAIESVMNGRPYLSSGLDSIIVEAFMQLFSPQKGEGSPVLTAREREVLQLIAEGNSTKGIAAKMCVSTKTIETHRGKIMKKLDLHSIAELTKYAIREGLTTVD